MWTRAYAAELFPGPVTPLGWDLLWEGAGVLGWRDAFVERMGLRHDEVDEVRPELIGVFGGYAYVNAAALRVVAERTPGLVPEHFDAALAIDQAEPPAFEYEPWHDAPDMSIGPLTDWMNWVLEGQNQSDLKTGRVLSIEARSTRPPIERMSDVEVVERALSLRPLTRALVGQYVNQTMAASIGPAVIASICEEIGMGARATDLVSGLGGIETMSEVNAAWSLSRVVNHSEYLSRLFDKGIDGLYAELCHSNSVDAIGFLAGFEALVTQVGFRGDQEWDLGGITWQQEPQVPLASIYRMRHLSDDAEPARRLHEREVERQNLAASITEILAPRPDIQARFGQSMASTTTFVRGREMAKNNMARVLHEVRLAVQELSERAVTRGHIERLDDLDMLFVDELLIYAGGGLSEIGELVSSRRNIHDRLEVIRPPRVIVAPIPGGPPDASGEYAQVVGHMMPLETGEAIFGKPGSPGTYQGRARVVNSLWDAAQTEEGEIIVAPNIPPAWLPMLVGAGALVVDQGGLLSHVTIAARELGIPAVVGAVNAASGVAEGGLIHVDGTSGIVTIIESNESRHPDDEFDLQPDLW